MKVLYITSAFTGGAGIAAKRIADQLEKYPLNLEYLTNDRIKSPRNTVLGKALDKYKFLKYHYNFKKYLQGRPAGFEQFTNSRQPDVTPVPFSSMPDLIHLHFISGMADYPSFFSSIPSEIPVVWSFHDMEPFTGGCHYSLTCAGFKTDCMNCKQLNSFGQLANNNLKIKEQAYSKNKINIVANSNWLEEQIRESYLFRNHKDISTIHLGVDTNEFYPLDKKMAKTCLGLDPDEVNILFGAENLNNQRKGFRLLLDAVGQLNHSDSFLLTSFGRKANFIPENVRYKSFGPVNSPDLLRVIYSAADIFVIPSIEEAFGQTAVEAMACGTPVAGFRTGGIKEIVADGKTGLLADTGNLNALRNAIEILAGDGDLRNNLAENAVKVVSEKFNISDVGSKYYDLYKQVLR